MGNNRLVLERDCSRQCLEATVLKARLISQQASHGASSLCQLDSRTGDSTAAISLLLGEASCGLWLPVSFPSEWVSGVLAEFHNSPLSRTLYNVDSYACEDMHNCEQARVR